MVDGNFKTYDFTASLRRIDDILEAASGQFEEVDRLPDRDRLTFTNGFYAQFASAIFVDLRESSKLPSHYQRPRLAKIYRAFISEMVAILNSTPQVREVNIVGDCVWAVYSSPLKTDDDAVFSCACQANSLMQVLNHKLKKHGFDTPIRAGIGLADGRALMIKAGFNGSGINDVVYMGEVVNQASKLAGRASRTSWDVPILVDRTFYEQLNDHNRGLLRPVYGQGYYGGHVVDTRMDEWLGGQA